jgi:hypothetical protein
VSRRLVREIVLAQDQSTTNAALEAYADGRPRVVVRPICCVPTLPDIRMMRDVIIDCGPHDDGSIAVSWKVSAGGAFPPFCGRLRVCGAPPNASRLRLEGSYGCASGDAPHPLVLRFMNAVARKALETFSNAVLREVA